MGSGSSLSLLNVWIGSQETESLSVPVATWRAARSPELSWATHASAHVQIALLAVQERRRLSVMAESLSGPKKSRA